MTTALKYLAAAGMALTVFVSAGVPLASAQTYYPNYSMNSYGYQAPSYQMSSYEMPSYQSYSPSPAGHIVYENGVATWTDSTSYTYTSTYSGTSYEPSYQYSYPSYNSQSYDYGYQYPSSNYNYNYSYQYPSSYQNGYGNQGSNSNCDSFNPAGHIVYENGVAYWQQQGSSYCY